MTVISLKSSALMASLAIMLLSCSDKGPITQPSLKDLEEMRISKEKIGGMSQKGPFFGNSSVALYELDDKLTQKGRSFQGMTDSRGDFEIRGVELGFPYALLKVDGFYRNEITGKESVSQITLYAIANMEDKNSVNVNIMTHLEYHRVQALVGRGKSIREAKQQAQREILGIFGINGSGFNDSEDMSIFGNTDSDAALLAISVLLQGDRETSAFSVLLADFSQKLKENGTWDNKAKKAEIAKWAAGANLEDIESKILDWDLASAVPDFKKYVRNYAAANSDVGNCKNLNPDEEFCYGGTIYNKCGDKDGVGKSDYNPGTHFCYNNYLIVKCGGQEYDPISERCNFGAIERLCDAAWYSIKPEFCYDYKDIYEKCGGGMGVAYIPETEKCCGTGKALKDEECCGNGGYNKETHFCRDNSVYAKCGGKEYNPSTHYCNADGQAYPLYPCGSQIYEPSTQGCCNNAVFTLSTAQRCQGSILQSRCGSGELWYNPSAQGCCGNAVFTLSTAQRCQGSTLESRCGSGELWYNPLTQFCLDNAVAPLCGGLTYTSSQFCYDDAVYDKCGTADFVPATHFCDTRESKLYKYVEIGSQIWMAENLNYNAIGSKCYGDNSGGDSQNRCGTYGRLYDWNTANAVCPTGWHLPSDEEWTALTDFAGGESTAGTKLKSKTGWSTNNGTDEFGFSALPGGNFTGGFGNVGNYGFWWSATESNSGDAWGRTMRYDYSNVIRDNFMKPAQYSVRCVKDGTAP